MPLYSQNKCQNKQVLCIGSPIEYVLESKYANLGLPDGAAKHLLII